MDSLEPLMTTDEVAGFLKVDVVTVRRLVSRGELAAYRVGGEYRFARPDLLAYLQRQRLPARETSAGAEPPWLARLLEGARGQREGGGRQHGLTRRARNAVQFAADAARQSGGCLGTEHLLLGLVQEGEGVAARVLAEIGITADAVRAILAAADELPERRGAPAQAEEAPLTEQARRALATAAEQAREWEHEYVGTEHLLFALTRIQDGNVTFVLELLGVAPDTVQGEVLRILGLSPAPPGDI